MSMCVCVYTMCSMYICPCVCICVCVYELSVVYTCVYYVCVFRQSGQNSHTPRHCTRRQRDEERTHNKTQSRNGLPPYFHFLLLYTSCLEYSQEEVESPGSAGTPDVGGDPLVEAPQALHLPDGAHAVDHPLVLGTDLHSVTHWDGAHTHTVRHTRVDTHTHRRTQVETHSHR